MDNKDKGEFSKIILTAIVTSALTLASSYFLLVKQYKTEEEYWSKRSRTERLQNLLNNQIKLFEEINSGILSTEVMAKELKLDAVEFTAMIKILQTDKETGNLITGKEFQEKQVAYHNKINELGAKLQMAELYFGNGIDTIIKDLGSSLEANYKHNLIFKDSLSTENLNSVLEYFKRDFETIEVLEKNRLKIIKAMRTDMLTVANEINEVK